MWFGNSGKAALFATILLVLVLSGARMRDLTYPDELRYAEVAREMLERRTWALPTLNYEVYPDKPPLFFWLVALSMGLLGATPLAAVLPSILAALLAGLLTYRIGKEVFDPETGWLGSFVFMTLLLVLLMAQVVRMDMLLTLLTTAAIDWFVRAIRRPGDRGMSVLWGYVLIAMALLTKGPVGLLIPALAILGFLVLTGQRHRILSLRLDTGTLIVAALTLAWLFPAVFEGGWAYLKEIAWAQNAGRIADSFAHAKPFYYYLIISPALFFPWSFYLILYLDPTVRQSCARNRSAMKLLLCWLLAPAIVFSLISGKIAIYLLPVTPALALLIARPLILLASGQNGGDASRYLKTAAFLLALSCLGLSIAMASAPIHIGGPLPMTDRLPTMGVFAAGGVGLLLLVRRTQAARTVVATGVLSVALVATLSLWLIPRSNGHLSLKPMANTLRALQDESHRLAGYKTDLRYLSFYLHRPYQRLHTKAELAAHVQEGPGLLLSESADRLAVEQTVGHPLQEVARFHIKRNIYLLLRHPAHPGSIPGTL